MKKFYVWSDLHTELSSLNHVKKICKTYFKKDLNSSLILAGDIGKPGDKKYLYLLEWCSRRYNKIFVIAGNHEFYNTTNVVDTLRNMCMKFPNVYFLDKNIYYSDSYIIFGCILWTHIHTIEIHDVKKYYNDFKYINNIDINTWHDSDLNWLTNALEYYKNDNRTKIVITHHMPSYSLLESKYKQYSLFNSAFANTDCEKLFSNVDYWIYGHTHTSHLEKINNCTFLCNPIGYKDENKHISSMKFKIN